MGFVSLEASGKANGSIERKSEFARYKTYVVEENVGVEVRPIRVKAIKDLIESLSNEIKQ